MSELGRLGPPLPGEQAAREEHFREVGEDVQHEKAADKVVAGSSTERRGRPTSRSSDR